MTSFKILSKKTILIVLLCVVIFATTVIFNEVEEYNELDNIICKSTLRINYRHSMFKGLAEYKAGINEGIVNLSGYIVMHYKK